MKKFRNLKINPERIQRVISLFALTGFMAFLAMPVTTHAAEHVATQTNGDATVTSQEVYGALKKTSGVLEASKQTKVTSDDASSLKAASAGASLTLPKDAKKGVKLEHIGVAVSVPNSHKAKSGKTVANGVIAYEGVDGSANAIQANNDGSVRMLTVIDNPKAPTKYDYQLTLPQDAQIQLEQDGSATIRKVTSANTGEVIATIDTPWAKDAIGKEIKTYYTVKDAVLTQHLNHRVKGITYPITADPVYRKWWGFEIQLNRNQTNNVMLGMAGATAASLGIPDATASKITAAALAGASGYANWAYNRGGCLKLQVTYARTVQLNHYYGGSCR